MCILYSIAYDEMSGPGLTMSTKPSSTSKTGQCHNYDEIQNTYRNPKPISVQRYIVLLYLDCTLLYDFFQWAFHVMEILFY